MSKCNGIVAKNVSDSFPETIGMCLERPSYKGPRILSQFAKRSKKVNTGTSKLKRNSNPEESRKETLLWQKNKQNNYHSETPQLYVHSYKQVIVYLLGSTLC